ncbi:unnamed protein product [Rhizoctonia solani]|uniref:DUF6535 domain-containing protein n=2 Tax=Rhizoctonia solani TaxID=456999 RepID=A0A8H2ZZJ2_9AGAM|nr:unnamed protein product [Rhizoctonia solani]
MLESLARNLTKIYQFYPVDPPQEFDEPGKELGPDAQVWKTYVREADQVDEEKVDGWNKSMDVILIFAALFSAISTAFVIESYKNLKPDPADVSSRTLLTISQTLAAIANGSQPAGSQSSSDTEVDDPPFSASWSAICVNVLWFLSLSLSVAVSLISMLAKEWCLKFMSNRTGPPGLQARRRQLRWEKLVSWRMEEVLMILPSLIHLSLLLFAIGLSVFLWDVHFGVAIPVVFVTTVAAAAYVTCTVLPFVDKYCPYGTVLSILCRRFIELRERTTYTSGDLAQDETTAKSLVWMIENCETPRSVDVALQSLAGATKGMPYKPLAEWDVWTMIKRRLGAQDPSAQNAAKNRGDSVYARALLSVTSCRDNDDGLECGSKPEARRLEALALGLQSCIDIHCNRIMTQEPPCDAETKRLLGKCATIGVQLLKLSRVTSIRPGNEWKFKEFWDEVMNPEQLVDEIANHLEHHLQETIKLGLNTYPVLHAIIAFLLCSCSSSVIGKCITKLFRAYVSRVAHLKPNVPLIILRTISSDDIHSQEQWWKEYVSQDLELSFLLGLLPTFCAPSDSKLQHPEVSSLPIQKSLEAAIEYIWQFLISGNYVDKDVFDHYGHRQSGVLHLLTQYKHYDLSAEDCAPILEFAIGRNLPYTDGLKSNGSRIQFSKRLNSYPATHPHVNWATLSSHIVELLADLLGAWPNDEPFVPTPEIYLLTVKSLCHAETTEQKQTGYKLMTRFPFPKLSSKFTQLLSSSDTITRLANAQKSDDPAIQAFATAQLWLFFNMSLEFPDCTSKTLTRLENALLQYLVPERDMDNQQLVVGELETQLILLIEEYYNHFKEDLGDSQLARAWPDCAAYLYRILECIYHKQGNSLPEPATLVLDKLPGSLRSWKSSVYLEGEAATKEAILADSVGSDI